MKENNFPEDFGLSEDQGFFDEDGYQGRFSRPAVPEDSFSEEEPLEEYSEEELNEEFPGDVYLDEIDEEPLDEVYHESLVPPETAEELTGNDHAMYSAGLTHPEDEEFRFREDYPAEEPQMEYTDSGEDPALLEEPPAEELRPRRERPARKGRPRRKKGAGLLGIPHLIATVIWLLIILAIGVSLGRVIWVCAADVLAFGREDQTVTVSITTDDTMDSIAEKLQDAGLIRYKDLFLLYADLAHAEDKITTGTFTLNTLYDYNALVKQMSPRSGNRAVVEDVLIPEGYSCRQIFQRLEEKGVCNAADLEEWAANGELGDYWFLEGVERGDKYCLEGYLFPATYDFYENSTPKQVLTKMLDAFELNFTEEMHAQITVLNERVSEMMRADGKSEDFIAQNQIGLRELVTVASLIEKETASPEESPRIASVIYNRLFRWGDTPRYLNIDASVIYALDGKTDLTAEDMAVDSPYNTYTNTGLTPGPISNPGIASMNAALNPEDTAYYYYVLNPQAGEHQFSKTYEEHVQYVEQFKEASGE